MDSLQASYKGSESEEDPTAINPTATATATATAEGPQSPSAATELPELKDNIQPKNDTKEHHELEPPASDSVSEDATKLSSQNDDDEEDDDEDDEDPPPKKQKQLSSLTEPKQEAEETLAPLALTVIAPPPTTTTAKKSSKKKNNNVWASKTSRKGKKKTKANGQFAPANEDTVAITPVAKFPDKSDDTAHMKICLSKVYKAEKVELSEDRLNASCIKGYRMVRATRGVVEGAWYFEIKLESLGETGHTRLGWSTEKGDLQAPVGYDGNSFGYRDIDGSKVHKALREKYGEEGYKEGDVIGCYINLPKGGNYAPKQPHLVWYKGQRYAYSNEPKEEPPKIVPGSEISFFKNGKCQGTAFQDLFGGRYYPAASMYTLPKQPNCVVKFNFGPDFDYFPEDFGGRPIPLPMVEVPYHAYDNRIENGSADEKKD
ncbi:hypothetical protein ACFE04_004735 [Oxalis oulophora]